MPALYVVEHGAVVRHAARRLIVEKDGQEVRSLPLAQVDELVLVGNADITTPTVKLLLYEGVDTVYLTADGEYCGRLVGPMTKHGELRRRQYERSREPAFAMRAARACVAGKLKNMRALLMRYDRQLDQPEIAAAVDQLAAQARSAEQAEVYGSLLGVEGAGSAAYFAVFGRLFKRDWGFRKRMRRPPPDPVNVLLSFGYTLLAKMIEAAVATAGLDPYIGYLHMAEHGRPSLALDLMEEFRPIVADSVALRCMNADLVRPEDFTPGETPERPVVLSEEGRRRFIAEFEARVADEFIHPALNERATYRRCFELQARAMAAAIRGGPAYAPMLVR
jgi:CRISPR-associated protein Cas1